MGNFKKIIAVLLCMTAMFCLYSQSSNSSLENISEDSIVLTDNSTALINDSSSIQSGSKYGPVLKMIFSLLFVIAIIVGIYLFIKRKTNFIKNDDEYLRRAAFINIAPNKTVEVITLIDKAYLIGVTEDNITLLGEIDDKELIQAMNINADKKANTSKPINFAQVLDSFLVKAKNTKNIFSSTESKVDDFFDDSTNSLSNLNSINNQNAKENEE